MRNVNGNEGFVLDGIIDLRLSTGSAELACEKLAQRAVPFIFYTGALPEPHARSAGAPPATVPTILGTRRYVLSAEPRDVVVPLDAHPDLVSAICAGEERITRIRALIARLEALGSDTSVSKRLLASIYSAVKTMRYSTNICTEPPWRATFPSASKQSITKGAAPRR